MCPSYYNMEFANRAVIGRGYDDLPQTQGPLPHSRPVTPLNAVKRSTMDWGGGGGFNALRSLAVKMGQTTKKQTAKLTFPAACTPRRLTRRMNV
jgi:hypothetical protein